MRPPISSSREATLALLGALLVLVWVRGFLYSPRLRIKVGGRPRRATSRHTNGYLLLAATTPTARKLFGELLFFYIISNVIIIYIIPQTVLALRGSYLLSS